MREVNVVDAAQFKQAPLLFDVRSLGQEHGGQRAQEQEGVGAVSEVDIHDVWSHYRTHHPRARLRITPKSAEHKKIKAALSEGFSVGEVCEAIDGFHLSPFHCGDNDRGTKYLGIKTILRDSDQIEKGREFYHNPPRNTGSIERTTRTLLEEWANEGQANEGRLPQGNDGAPRMLPEHEPD